MLIKRFLGPFLLIVLSLLGHAQDSALALIHVNVIDMRSDQLMNDVSVVIKGQRIASVSKQNNFPREAKVIDAKGKFLIPGLWDMHVHIRNLETIFFPLFLANGITGIREMHYPGRCYSIGNWKDSLSKATSLAPRIGAAAGCAVDGAGDMRGWDILVARNEAEGRQTVQQLKQSGADFVKVYARLTLPTFTAIAAEAKKLNLPLEGHLPVTIPATLCSELGQKSFEHMIDFHRYCSSEEAEILKAYADSLSTYTPASTFHLLKRAYETYTPEKAVNLSKVMIKNSTWVCPTLYWFDVVHNRVYQTAKGRKRIEDVPVGINQKWAPKSVIPMTEVDSILHVKLFIRELELLSIFHKQGVKLLAGTDCSIMRYVIPGFSLHDELTLYVQAGLSPYEALKTATVNPAVFLNRSDELGTIEKGKLADLVLLDANPLANIMNTRKINAVILKGQFLNHHKLVELLEGAERNAR